MVDWSLPFREKIRLTHMPKSQLIINFTLFQIGWFACILGAAKQLPWLGVIVVTVIVAWHLQQAKQAKPELILLALALLIGGMFDQLMLSSHLISYQAHGWGVGQDYTSIVPAWILALWAVFATVLNVSLRWMKNIKSSGKWLLAILFGAIGGPLAYMGAQKLGAATLNTAPMSYVALSLGWGILTPLLLKISEKFDGFE